MCEWKEIRERSTFMAIGALFRVKTIRGDAKHIIALNADAMDHARAARQWGSFRGVLRSGRMLCHDRILT
jgi:hypothetical protein